MGTPRRKRSDSDERYLKRHQRVDEGLRGKRDQEGIPEEE
jgi:hypothetical protein